MLGWVIAIIVLGLLILIHELGHFITAKLFGVKILKFSIGFGPAILKRKKEGTEYTISAIPWGGYVKPLDEDVVDITLSRLKGDKDVLRKEVLNVLEITEEDLKKSSLSSKPIWQRLITVLAGPTFNFISGAFVMVFAFYLGMESLSSVVGEIKEKSPAEIAGIKPGDRIVEVDSEKIETWSELKRAVSLSGGRKLKVTVEREGRRLTFELSPERTEIGDWAIGVLPSGEKEILKYPIPKAVHEGFKLSCEITLIIFKLIWNILTSEISSRVVGGPLSIIKATKEAFREGVPSLLFIIFLISINLAILNLLPIPLLDGGHIVFFILEAITRRRIPFKVKEVVAIVGLAILLSIIAFAIFNDILMLLGK